MKPFTFSSVIRSSVFLVRKLSATFTEADQCRHAQTLAEQLQVAADSLEWRPIETVPRDGTPVNVCGTWQPTWTAPERHQAVASFRDASNHVPAFQGKATHWHPLIPYPDGEIDEPRGRSGGTPSSSAPAHPLLDHLHRAAASLDDAGIFWQATQLREDAYRIEMLLKESARYDYLLDCEFVSTLKYLPDTIEAAFKAQLRARHDGAIAAGGVSHATGPKMSL